MNIAIPNERLMAACAAWDEVPANRSDELLGLCQLLMRRKPKTDADVDIFLTDCRVLGANIPHILARAEGK